MKYWIVNSGCDDDTILVTELTDKEKDIFIKICKKLNKNASYCCQPIIHLYRYDEYNVNDLLKEENK